MPIATFIPFGGYGRPNKCSRKIKNRFFEIKLFQFKKRFIKLLVFYFITNSVANMEKSTLDKNMKYFRRHIQNPVKALRTRFLCGNNG